MNYPSFWLLTVLCCLPLLSFSQEPDYGYAVYYADYLHGQPTASGEIYDKNKYTCAHRTHPMGTILRVTRLDNDRFVTVRVNDRGPVKEDRIVDVSRVAAEQLDLIQAGKAKVMVEVIGYEELPQPSLTQRQPVNTAPGGLFERSGGHPATLPPSSKSKPKKKKKKKSKPVESYETTEYSRIEIPATDEVSFTEKSVASVAEMPANQTGFAIQLASFSIYDNAVRQIDELKNKGMQHLYLKRAAKSDGSTLFKVVVGPFNYRENAAEHLEKLKVGYGVDGLVVGL